MIRGYALLLVFQLIGEAAARGFDLPVPGPVIGLVFLALAMAAFAKARKLDSAEVEHTEVGRAALSLIASLGVLFVPAGVGIMQQYGLLLDHGIALFIALVISTLLTLIATVWVFLFVKHVSSGTIRGGAE